MIIWNDENDKKEVKEDNNIKIAYYNLANAQADEKSESYRYAQREHLIIDAINEAEPDILSVMELRVCSDVARTRLFTPEELAIRLSNGTRLEIAACKPQNLDDKAFWRATLYNADKVDHVQSFCRFALAPVFGSPAPQDRGVMFLFSKFREIASGRTFWVINSHLPIALKEKLKSVQWLNENVPTICGETPVATAANPLAAPVVGFETPLVFYGGDQNTFFDDGGHDQMALFLQKWDHLSAEASPTFESFPQDPTQTVSTLDHIFCLSGANDRYEKVGNAMALPANRASDHYLMTVTVKIL